MFFFTNNKIDNTIILLFSFFPIFILTGNFLINISIIIIGSLFLFKIIKNEINFSEYKIIFYLLIFFFSSLVINLIFSNDFYLSYQRVTKFFFVIFFILAFRFLILNYNRNLKNVYRIWSIIFLIVIIDLIIEFFLGKNILGQNSIMPGRLGSFTGEESVVGHFFFGFCLIFLASKYELSKKITLNMFLVIFLIIISFMIGERANFIRTSILIIAFVYFIFKFDFKIKTFSIIFTFIAIFFVLPLLTMPMFKSTNKDHYKMRYYDHLEIIFTKDGVSKYLENSQYGAHRNVAKEIFLENPIFGVGIKNFRIESADKKYDKLKHKKNHLRIANHPHELYYEFLSETGLFGLTFFLIFILSSIILAIRSLLKNKNIYQFSSILFVIVSILPILPTGSFLATYASSIFWINYAIMMGYCNFKKIK